MNRTQKQEAVQQLTERFHKAQTAVFADYRGLTVAQMTQLRVRMRGVHGALHVVKNRLAKRALEAAKISGLDKFFTGPTAVASSEGDAAALAKTLVDFAKENETLKLKGGYVEGKVIELHAVKALATLPSRDVLLAQVFGLFKTPATQLVNVLAAVPRQLVTVLKAIEGVKK